MRSVLAMLLLLAAVPVPAYEGFEGGLGGWTATGLWHRVVAPACFTPHEGSAAVYLGRDGACDYADGRIKDDVLRSPAVLLNDPATAFISFWMLYQVESFQPVCYDNIRLERSDDGVNWALLRKLGPGADPPGGGPGLGYASGGGLGGPALWEFVKVDLSAFVPGTLHLRFRFVSSGSQAGEPLCLGQPDADMDHFLGVALDEIRFGHVGPRLSLAKSVVPGFGSPGSELTYRLAVRNDDNVARDLTVWDSLPTGLNFVAADHGGSFGGGRVDWALPGVAPGAAITLELRVQADPALSPPQDLLNSADAGSDAPGGVQRSPAALFKLRAPGLALRHSAEPASIISGDFATYNLVVENYSPLTQTALSLGLQLPVGLVQSGTWPALSGPARWDLPDLGPGQVRSFSLWGRGFGEDGALLTVNGRLSQGGGLLIQRPASVLLRKPIEPTVHLKAVYPNPAPSDKAGLPQSAYVYYSTNIAMPMTLDIYTIAGEKVRSLPAPGAQGAQQVAWDLKNQWGRPVASGVYAFRLWSSMPVIPTPEAFGYIAVLW
jgi:uncharacterized repeat protein (TIGR01451 family)